VPLTSRIEKYNIWTLVFICPIIIGHNVYPGQLTFKRLLQNTTHSLEEIKLFILKFDKQRR